MKLSSAEDIVVGLPPVGAGAEPVVAGVKRRKDCDGKEHTGAEEKCELHFVLFYYTSIEACERV